MTNTNHTYRRPTWVCCACGEPWPCANRRATFLARAVDYTERTRLRAILAVLQVDAARDLGLTTAEADARFTGWIGDRSTIVMWMPEGGASGPG